MDAGDAVGPEEERAAGADGLRLAVSLLTVVPIRCGRVDRETARRAMILASAAGLLVGAAAAVVLTVTGWLGAGPLLGSALAVGAMALLTRGLHLDGLADLADGLGSGRPAEGALSIMKRSDIGPFGVITLTLTLLIQVAALAQAPHRAVAVTVAAVTGRLAVTWACREGVPAARPEGLGALVARTVRRRDAVAVTVVVMGAAAIAGLLAGGTRPALLAPAAVAAGLLVAAALLRHAVRRLGGVTGDVLGALVETSVTAAIVVMSVA
ncbi:adenosylcobinamide-GDP ribazoletransferase [Actinoallomurus purpureus]|uniref:adenosylcobinamide-GDP ribazoletransferase n=1 Tax=Actinoallomurus purpureus TaxID=478114 RepID=UPI0020933491|nr:adenosylcobinamide-GDP ribazoletransferase [Actinoallomurus purpureus]MCO6005656.1 adenosylcobinamide-GDP ribazoletransferase [Actinoallomurus purpureus]